MTSVNLSGWLKGAADLAAGPTLNMVLHGAFILLLLSILTQMVRPRKPARQDQRLSGSLRMLFGSLIVLFAAVLMYQATWQLTGVLRPQFIAFMQRHDHRKSNPAHRIQRGRVLDHRGTVLAYSQERQGIVRRVYPYGPVFAHTVGYIDPHFGSAGIEAVASVHLNGGSPATPEEWGELGRQLVTQDKTPRGQDLVLTLDAGLQQWAAARLGPRAGAIVLLRPDDGAIQVLVSTPAYDPNRIGAPLFRESGPNTPLLNRATQGLYPPGSTFKIIMAAMALNAGFKGTLFCPADGFTTSRRFKKIRDHDYYSARQNGEIWLGHGRLDLATAFAESSNVFFAQLGVLSGHDRFYRTIDQFYFNRQIPLHENANGNWSMRTGDIPRLAGADQYGLAQMSIGQGQVLVTPAHMALVAAAVAHQGIAMKPRLVNSDPPVALDRFMPAATARRLANLMRRVVVRGTGRGIDVKELAIAGKTGTAQNPRGEAHSWFVGFAPAERPALAVAVLVEHGGYGASVAAPIARDLLLQAKERGLMN